MCGESRLLLVQDGVTLEPVAVVNGFGSQVVLPAKGVQVDLTGLRARESPELAERLALARTRLAEAARSISIPWTARDPQTPLERVVTIGFGVLFVGLGALLMVSSLGSLDQIEGILLAIGLGSLGFTMVFSDPSKPRPSDEALMTTISQRLLELTKLPESGSSDSAERGRQIPGS